MRFLGFIVEETGTVLLDDEDFKTINAYGVFGVYACDKCKIIKEEFIEEFSDIIDAYEFVEEDLGGCWAKIPKDYVALP